jgi:NADPH:quinone reductase-like Zn-dependent oxidoreductase
MQAVRAHEGGALRFEAVADPAPAAGEVVVELRCAALNRRDTLVWHGVYPFALPVILGSDGAGIRRDTGDEVVILPSLHWGDGETAPGPDFQILGGPRDGTYAELVSVPRENVFPKPARLNWGEGAAFPLAALTAYRALFTRGGLKPGETVVVLGAGSGVSTFAVQLAAHVGAKVLVTSSSRAKLDRSRELGAEGGALYTEGDWVEAVRELNGGRGVDLVVDSVGSTWPDSLRALAPGGRVVVFGATRGTEVTLQVRPVYLQQLSVLGTTMGSPRDFARLLRLIDEAGWKPVIDSLRPLADARSALERMESGAHFGKLVLACT